MRVGPDEQRVTSSTARRHELSTKFVMFLLREQICERWWGRRLWWLWTDTVVAAVVSKKRRG